MLKEHVPFGDNGNFHTAKASALADLAANPVDCQCLTLEAPADCRWLTWSCSDQEADCPMDKNCPCWTPGVEIHDDQGRAKHGLYRGQDGSRFCRRCKFFSLEGECEKNGTREPESTCPGFEQYEPGGK